MICSKCGYPNPNGFAGACKSCRAPLVVEAIQPVKTVAKKTQKTVSVKKPVEVLDGKNK
jgi:hypothetical protein